MDVDLLPIDIAGFRLKQAIKPASDAYMAIYFDLRFEEYYEKITCPVLMLPGEDAANDQQQLDIMTRLSKLPKPKFLRPEWRNLC